MVVNDDNRRSYHRVNGGKKIFVVVVNVTRCCYHLDDDNWLSINTMQMAKQNTIII